MDLTEKMDIARNIIYSHISETNPEATITITYESEGFNVYVNPDFIRFVCYFNADHGICNVYMAIHDLKRLAAQLKLMGFKVYKWF